MVKINKVRRNVKQINRNNQNLPKRRTNLAKYRMKYGGPGINRRSNASSALAYGTTINNQLPLMEGTYGKCRISHREPLGPIYGSVAFDVNKYELNPGIATTFPWLASIARNYEKYKFQSLRFEYVNRCNANFTGGITMAPDYDAADEDPTALMILQQYQNVYDGSVWKDGLGVLNPAAMGPIKFTRTGPPATNQDIKTYDVGNYFIATQGQADAVQVGELWVHYDVLLLSPQQTAELNIFNTGTYYNADGADAAVDDLIGLGLAEGSIVITHNGANEVRARGLIPGRHYRIEVQWVATTITTSATITFTQGLASLNATQLGGPSNYVVGSTQQIVIRDAVASQSIGIFTLGGITVLTDPTKIRLSIMPTLNLSN